MGSKKWNVLETLRFKFTSLSLIYLISKLCIPLSLFFLMKKKKFPYKVDLLIHSCYTEAYLEILYLCHPLLIVTFLINLWENQVVQPTRYH